MRRADGGKGVLWAPVTGVKRSRRRSPGVRRRAPPGSTGRREDVTSQGHALPAPRPQAHTQPRRPSGSPRAALENVGAPRRWAGIMVFSGGRAGTPSTGALLHPVWNVSSSGAGQSLKREIT